ncbi:MAG: Crp/Fnr family transcriptional regulator [Pseudomonadota bacterium]
MQTVLLMSAPAANAGNGRDPRLLEGLFSNLPLFRDIPQRSIAQIAAQSRTQRIRRGAALARKGEKLPGVVAMAYGSLKLALRRTGGDEKVVRFLGPNETFGEASILLDRPSPVDAVALADSMLGIIPAAPLQRLLENDSAFARNLVRILGARFLDLLGEVEATVQQNGVQRLAHYLDSLAEPNGDAESWIVRLPANKTTIAARLGVTKETMSRLLRELTNRELITVSRREIMIRDRARLAQLAG